MRFHPVSSAVALVLAGLALPAAAHIEYFDLNQGRQISDLTAAGKVAAGGNDLPLSNPLAWTAANQTYTSSLETWTSLGGSYASGSWGYSLHVINMQSSSWTDGLRTNPTGGANLLGNTHDVQFANFHLNQASYITISLTDGLNGQGYGLNPSFSLYKGSAVYQAHDDTGTDALNPKAGFPPVKIQNAKDNGTFVDSQGITSAYRNTLTNTGTYYGQFNAIGDWSIANAAGNFSAVKYVTSVTGFVNPDGSFAGNTNTNTLSGMLLQAGDYIIAFGGNASPVSYATQRSATTTSPDFGNISGMEATLTFNAVAAPVPEPEGWAMLLSGIALVGTLATRRRTRR